MDNKLEEIRKRVLIRVLDNGEIQAMFWTACDDRRWLLIEVERLTAIADAAEANLQETIHTHAEFVSLRLEVERLRAGMDFYANPVNWWWDSERNSWIWMGDNHPDMTACRALAGEE